MATSTTQGVAEIDPERTIPRFGMNIRLIYDP
jgi:hypothetical protein